VPASWKQIHDHLVFRLVNNTTERSGLAGREDRIICLVFVGKAQSTKKINEVFALTAFTPGRMAPPKDSQPREYDGFLSSYQLLTLYFPAFVFALGYSIATPAIPVFAKSFNTGFGVASLVVVAHALGALLATVPTGFLVDRMGRRPVLIAGPVLVAVSSGLTAVAQSFGELLIYRLIGGAAMEMWRQSRLAIIADVSKRGQRGRQMSGMVGTEGAGRLIGPALGGLLGAWSIRVPFVVHCILALLAITPSFFLVRESAPAAQTAKKTEDRLDTKSLLALMLDVRYRGFLSAQFFASMTRGVLWGGTLLLYATFAYDVGARELGGLATMSTVVGIPITVLMRLSDGPLRTEDHDGAGLCVAGAGVIFSCGERSMALGPGGFYRRFSVDACEPSGHGGKHAGARFGHGAGRGARAVFRFLALDRRDRRAREPGALRRSCRADGLLGFIRVDRFVRALYRNALGFLRQRNRQR